MIMIIYILYILEVYVYFVGKLYSVVAFCIQRMGLPARLQLVVFCSWSAGRCKSTVFVKSPRSDIVLMDKVISNHP